MNNNLEIVKNRGRVCPTRNRLKAVLFDMDGVLFDSMPYHAESWHAVMKMHGLNLSREEAYQHEGRTGRSTINLVCQRQKGREATEEEIESIYSKKTELFNDNPPAPPMPGALELLNKIKKEGYTIVLVTGSGQKSLLSRLEEHYPGIFQPDLMVTAFDVHHGKPHPEPYLMGLEKAGVRPEEALVVENAPLGVQAASAANIYTIAVNTGPLEPEMLLNNGADVLYTSVAALYNGFDSLLK